MSYSYRRNKKAKKRDSIGYATIALQKRIEKKKAR